jgi:5-methylthioadenosine/S-adenosylhomocysteine deaminase
LLGCAALTDEEFEVVKRSGTRVILDPISGTTLGVGQPPVLQAINSGNPTAVSTNGMASAGGQDLFEAMKTMLSLARTAGGGVQAMSVQRALEMATIEGARVFGLDKEVGSLEPGKRADVICVDLDNVFCAPTFDVVATLVCACTSRDVRDVVAAGQLVVRDRKLLVADEAELTARATRRAAAALERAKAVANR